MNRFPIENIDKVSASVNADSASQATQLANTKNIKLVGDVTGSASFDGTADANITATIADDSHNHVISNIDNLQSILNGKVSSVNGTTKYELDNYNVELRRAGAEGGFNLSIVTTNKSNSSIGYNTLIDKNGKFLPDFVKSLSISGKTITITKGDGTTSTLTTQDTDTTYTAGTGISLASNKFSLATVVTAGNAGPTANASPAHGGTFTVPYITYDAYGRVTGRTNRTITLPATPTTITGNAGSATKLATARNIKVTVNSKEGTTTSSTSSNCSFNGTGAITMTVTSYYVDTWNCSSNCCGGDGGAN